MAQSHPLTFYAVVSTFVVSSGPPFETPTIAGRSRRSLIL